MTKKSANRPTPKRATTPEQIERRRAQKRNYQRKYIADGRHAKAQERYRHTENGWRYNWEWLRRKRQRERVNAIRDRQGLAPL